MRKKVEKNTAAKKTVEKKAVSAVKPVVPEVKVEEKTETKEAETVSEVKPEVKEETTTEAKLEVKAEEKPAVKAAKKTTKAAAKKESAEKPAKTTKAAASSQKIVLQMSGREDLSMENIIERVKRAYVDEGHSAASIKNIEVYIKPEEGMAYYVIDGYASGISL